jgi:hypothetical protein
MLVLNPGAATALFAIGVIVHNIEEAIWLPAFGRDTGAPKVSAAGFRIVDLIFTLCVYVICLVALVSRVPATVYALAGIGGAMVLNAFIPHLLATIRFRRYAPGTATGLLLNVPLGTTLILSLLAAGWVNASVLVWALPLGVLCVAAITATLLWLAVRVGRQLGG